MKRRISGLIFDGSRFSGLVSGLVINLGLILSLGKTEKREWFGDVNANPDYLKGTFARLFRLRADKKLSPKSERR